MPGSCPSRSATAGGRDEGSANPILGTHRLSSARSWSLPCMTALTAWSFIPRDNEKRGVPTQTDPEPKHEVSAPSRSPPLVRESAGFTLSRWRHGFKSRWDYLTLRCANQRRNLVRRQDLLPGHHAKLLHEEPDERLPLLRRAAINEQLEVPSPLGHIFRHGSRRGPRRASFSDRLLGLQRRDPAP